MIFRFSKNYSALVSTPQIMEDLQNANFRSVPHYKFIHSALTRYVHEGINFLSSFSPLVELNSKEDPSMAFESYIVTIVGDDGR